MLILHEMGWEQHEEDDPSWFDKTWQSVKDWLSDAFWGMAGGGIAGVTF